MHARSRRDVRAHQSQDVEDAGAGRIDADVTQREDAFRAGKTAGHEEECGRGNIARHLDLRPSKRAGRRGSMPDRPSLAHSTPKPRSMRSV